MSNAKKDISKEAMFSKIMPSGPLTHTVAPTVKQSESRFNSFEDDREARAAAALEQRDNPDRTETAESTAKQTETPAKAPEKDVVQGVKVINITEKMVNMKITEAMERFDCCTCSVCRQDILCKVLNSISPKYMAVAESDIDKIIEKEDFSEVTQAIMKAILNLKANPNH